MLNKSELRASLLYDFVNIVSVLANKRIQDLESFFATPMKIAGCSRQRYQSFGIYNPLSI